MELKEFANLIDGRQYDYRMFTKEELQLAKDNRIVIVTGASDDLVELEGAITDEGDCWEGGKIYVKAIPNGGIVHNCERSDVFGFTAKWCEEKDKNGKIISWTYDVPIEHETFTVDDEEQQDELNRTVRLSHWTGDRKAGWEIRTDTNPDIYSLRHMNKFDLLLAKLQRADARIIIDETADEDFVYSDTKPEPTYE